jgi:NUDIX domain
VNETDLGAARREIKEELAVSVILNGPVHTSVSRFVHENALVDNTDVFFAGRLDQTFPQLYAASREERAAMQITRWWSCDELDQTTETTFPPDLSAVVRRLKEWSFSH